MATRIYLPATASTTVISPTPDAAWEDTSLLTRVRGRATKVGDTLTTVAFTDANNADRDVLFRQYVVPLIPGQTITGGQALKFQVRAIETAANNNLFTALGIRVIASNGTTVRKTVLAVTRDASEVSSTTLTNRQFTATSAATNYVTVNGDCLVIEIGTAGDPAGSNTHSSSLRLGDSAASDLAEDDASTTDNNPWVEFADTLTIGDPTVATGTLTLTATGAGKSNNTTSGASAITFTASAKAGSVGTSSLAFSGSAATQQMVEAAGTSALTFTTSGGGDSIEGVGVGADEDAGATGEDEDSPEVRLLLLQRRLGGLFVITSDDIELSPTATGTASITVTASGTGKANVTAVGTSNIVFSASGEPREGGSYSGGATVVSDDPEVKLLFWRRAASAFLIALDDLTVSQAAGTAAITVSATGAGRSTNESVGSTSVTFTADGFASGASSAVGTAAITFATSGDATSTSGSTGTSQITIAASGAATSTATAVGSTSITLDASGQVGCIGLSSITIQTAGFGQAASYADGGIAVLVSVAGAVQYRIAATGSASIQFTGIAPSVTSLRLTVALSNSSFNNVTLNNSRVNTVGLEDSLVTDVELVDSLF